MTSTIMENQVVPGGDVAYIFDTTDEPEKASHIVLVPADQPDENPQAYVLRARIEGFAITALCGYTFIPQQDPAKKPVCQPCLDIYRHDPKGHGDRDDLPDA